ncbi:MAG TPA: Gfo/Idh/MocA family oxidoreductase [Pirellulaceae bacterium]|nr:Gfo/Idh/MocA family oxidoreductase [Pirellulaceae bacterium]HMO90715.1 Gfo/Idh/MocA family oxidoreductase [Pirellulaceae bacterium]HMP71079.1 Gfo/Idh/MocA family oxidoreductase [Pirellulaceae bacterium]
MKKNEPSQITAEQNCVDNSSANQNRREFLQRGTAALTAGAVAASAALPQTAWAKSVHVAGSETIRIGLVGCGGRGTHAAMQALSTKSGPVILSSIADAFQTRVDDAMGSLKENLKERFESQVSVTPDDIHFGFDAFEKVLASDIDLVILATPPGFRPLHFEKAIAAGKHVFMEKPVAVDAPGVRRVMEASRQAEANGLAVGVGLQRRHERVYMETIDRLKQGEIGDIVLGRAYWNGDTPWVRNRRPGEGELLYQMRNWYFFNWLCGDHIVEQHIHNIDVINWLKDAYPVKAQGVGGREVRKGKDHGQIYDHHMIEFTYADGSKMLSQCRHQPGCWNEVAEYAHGTKGTCSITRGVIEKDGQAVFTSRGGRDGTQQELDDLFADLREGRIPNEGYYGALSSMTAIFGRMATYSGRELNWDECYNSQLTLADVDSIRSMDDEAPVQPDENGSYPIAIPGKNLNLVF